MCRRGVESVRESGELSAVDVTYILSCSYQVATRYLRLAGAVLQRPLGMVACGDGER